MIGRYISTSPHSLRLPSGEKRIDSKKKTYQRVDVHRIIDTMIGLFRAPRESADSRVAWFAAVRGGAGPRGRRIYSAPREQAIF